jgi:glutathione S-transferase
MQQLYYTGTDMGELARACITWARLSIETIRVESNMRLMKNVDMQTSPMSNSPKAIVMYLARLSKLLPTEPEEGLRIESLAMSMWDDNDDIRISMHQWEQQVSGLSVTRPTLVDFILYTKIKRAGMHSALANYPALHDWYKRFNEVVAVHAEAAA